MEFVLSLEMLARILAERACESSTTGSCEDTKHPLARYGADQMCAPCMARLALSGGER